MKMNISQYYPSKSPIHLLDARVKLITAIVFITMMFFARSYVSYGFVFVCLVLLTWASHLKFRILLRNLRGIMFIVSFTVLLNVFMTPGETVVFHYGIFRVTQEGLVAASKMAMRIMFIITGSSILTTLTTSPMQLTEAIERLLKPFKLIKVPAHEIAMMMSIALRFIPTLLEETDKIIKAQTARGAEFDTGGLIKKARAMVPLLVPLFVSAFRRADELATAMESRCYRGDVGRTKMKVARFGARDYIAFFVLVMYAGVIVGFGYLPLV
jgi:energy-coupling factor transport system permease protein